MSTSAALVAADARGKNKELSKEGYDFSQSSVENITQKRFDFGSQTFNNVDQTLANLFDALSVECRFEKKSWVGG